MPTDNRRIQGPEVSAPYILHSKSHRNLRDDFSANLLDGKARRKDGRACEEQRKVYMKTGVVSQAKGSAYVELNNTKVICSVFDPREIPNRIEYSQHGELYCVFKYAPFSCLVRRGHQPEAEEKELSLSLKRALEPAVCRHEFPNFQVDVYALVLQNDGAALAAAITCAGLALADAHVPMYDLVTATTVGVYEDQLLVDPSAEEEIVCIQGSPNEDGNHGMVTLTLLGAHLQTSQIWQSGCMSAECLNKSVDILVKACESKHPLTQCCLVKSVANTIAVKQADDKEV